MSVEVRSGVRLSLLHSARRLISKSRITKSKISLFFVTGIAFGLGIYATVDPHWAESVRIYHSHGLWKECYTEDEFRKTECFDLLPEHHPLWLNMCRAGIVIGDMFIFIGLITSFSTLLNDNIHGYYTSVTMFLGAIFMGSVVIIYHENKKWQEEHMECSESYFCAWLGAVMCVMAAFFGFCTF